MQSQWQVELKVSAEQHYYSIEICHYSFNFDVHDILASDERMMSFAWVNANTLQWIFFFLQELPEGEWFCCSSCSGTRLSLEKIISDGAQPLAEPDIEIIRMKHEIRGLCMDTSTDLKCQLLSGKRATEDGRILLSAAVPIFHVGPVLFDLICSSSALFSGLSIFVLFPLNAFSYGHLMIIGVDVLGVHFLK